MKPDLKPNLKIGLTSALQKPGSSSETDPFPTHVRLHPDLPPVCRLGLATRGNTHLPADSVVEAVERGVNYLNWCGYDDGISQALPRLTRDRVVVAIQMHAQSAREARRELEEALRDLKTEWIDVVTFYYVERESEWRTIAKPGGALEVLRKAQAEGKVRMIGLTTHQREFGARLAETGALDLLMIRYNAAHRGAEQDVFPITTRLKVPVVCYTALRWRGLLKPTKEDPPGFSPAPAREWYRFALAHPAASVVLTAPGNHREMVENLKLLEDWRPPEEEEFNAMASHGAHVRKWAGTFP